MTFEQLMIKVKNQMIKLAQPIMKLWEDIINSEAVHKITQTFMKLFAVAMAIIYPIMDLIRAIGQVISDNWGIIEPILFAIIGGLILWWTWTKLLAIAHGIQSIALGIKTAWTLADTGAIAGNTLAMKANQLTMSLMTKTISLYTALTKAGSFIMGIFTGATWAQVYAQYGLMGSFALVIGIIVGVIAVIYAVVLAYNKFTGASVSALGVVVGAFWTFFSFLYNNFTILWNFIVSIAEFLVNVWTNPIYTVKKLFGSLAKSIINVMLAIVSPIDSVVTGIVNGVVEGINWVLGLVNDVVNGFSWALNKIGIDAGTIDLGIKYESKSVAADMEHTIKNIDKWIGEEPENYHSFDNWRLDPKDLGEAWDEGYNKGAEWESGISDFFGGLLDVEQYYPEGYDPEAEWKDSQEDYVPPGTEGDYPLSDDITDYLDNLDGNVEDIKDISEEDLKYLRDLAEQKVINRFTTAEIRIDNHMNNNINSDRDLDGIVNYLTDEMYKAAHSTAEGLHY